MFEGVRRSYALLILLLMEIIEELGTDRGLEMLQTSVEKQAAIIARELRRKIPENSDLLDTSNLVYRAFMEEAGAELAVHEKTEDSITYRVKRCPFYEAFLDVGIDCGYFLGGLCTHLTLPAIQAALNHFRGGLKLEPLLVRESAEEFCLERISLEDT
ncbi:MAG: L-2-amino-thiazoline-4-carboxylic acid hydrolase [Candidatus Bathyarchaeota archaeon]|nr:MAG: L-2-amino-thiazoline-4-carboxylic acid hydrolase [Candidatus Bathyarchaeota archaeon]